MTLTTSRTRQALHNNEEGTTMPYKYVLVGMHYTGNEPNVYPKCVHDEDDWYCRCEQNIADAIETSIRQNQYDVRSIDVGFLQYQNDQEYFYRSWTKQHAKELYKRYLWKIFVFLYKR